MIQGKKTYLRPVTADDIETVMIWENDPELWQYTESQGPFSRTTIFEFIEASSDLDIKGQLRYMIFDEEDEPIGALDLFHFEKPVKSAGIGIMIANHDDRKKGYAHDALSALIAFYKEEKTVSELRCLIHADNTASISLFNKNGFLKMGKKLFKGKDAIQFVLHL